MPNCSEEGLVKLLSVIMSPSKLRTSSEASGCWVFHLSGCLILTFCIYYDVLTNLSKISIPGLLATAVLGPEVPESGSATRLFRDPHGESGQGLEARARKQPSGIKTNVSALLGNG